MQESYHKMRLLATTHQDSIMEVEVLVAGFGHCKTDTPHVRAWGCGTQARFNSATCHTYGSLGDVFPGGGQDLGILLVGSLAIVCYGTDSTVQPVALQPVHSAGDLVCDRGARRVEVLEVILVKLPLGLELLVQETLLVTDDGGAVLEDIVHLQQRRQLLESRTGACQLRGLGVEAATPDQSQAKNLCFPSKPLFCLPDRRRPSAGNRSCPVQSRHKA